MIYSKEIVREWLDEVAEWAMDHPEWVDVFERCYTDTLDNTVEILEDGSAFVLTGDILCHVASRFDSPTQALPSCS